MNVWGEKKRKKGLLPLTIVLCRIKTAACFGERALAVCPLCYSSGDVWCDTRSRGALIDVRDYCLCHGGVCLGSTSLSTHLRRRSVIHEFAATRQPDMSGQTDRLTAGETERFFLKCAPPNSHTARDIPSRDEQKIHGRARNYEHNEMILHTLQL